MNSGGEQAAAKTPSPLYFSQIRCKFLLFWVNPVLFSQSAAKGKTASFPLFFNAFSLI